MAAPVPPPAPPARRRIQLAVVVVVSIGVLLAFVDVRELLDVLRRIPLGVVAIAVAVLSLDRFMMGFKWRHLVRSAGARMRLTDAVAIYYQSKFTTLVFPAAFGGEVLRGVLGIRAGVPSHVLVASMVMERVVAGVSSLILAAAGLSYLGTLTSYARYDRTVTSLVAAAGGALVVVTLLALHRPSHKLVGRMIGRWVPERLFRLLDRLSATAVGYKHAPLALFTNLGLTLVEHLLHMLALYVLARGVGVQFSLVHFLAATSIVMLVRRGAGFLEGWGIAESGVVMLYTLFGVPATRSAALALALWAVSLVSCLPGGYLLWRSAWRSAKASRRGRNAT